MKHPAVKRDANDALALDQHLCLLVCQLPLVGDERAIVVMAGEHRAVIPVHGLVETLIRKMRHVEDHADALHLLEERLARRKEASFSACAMAIWADAVVRRADDA